jgi:hypothetical protein
VEYVAEAASSLSSAQRSGLEERLTSLGDALDTVSREIEETTARRRTEEPGSRESQADARALAQLSGQQTELVLNIDEIKGRMAGSGSEASATAIQQASPANRPGLVARFAMLALAGALLVALLTAAIVVTVSRRDRRLRYRDELADALGGPVVASVSSARPGTVAGWTSLLGSYEASVVDAWAFRQALRLLSRTADSPASVEGEPRSRRPASIMVLSMTDDLRAVAVAPQLASYLASSGSQATLVAARGRQAAPALWAACAHAASSGEPRPGLVVAEHTGKRRSGLTVVMVVVDRHAPDLSNLPRTQATVLAVSAGSATAEDIARVAVAADVGRHRIDGLVVVDPDDLDKTSGRLIEGERSRQVPLPTRLTGVSGGERPTPEVEQGGGGS